LQAEAWEGDDHTLNRAGALVLWFIAANDVADATVVDGVRTRPVWGRFFWFVRARSDRRRDLRTGF
jgi:hypothetical protein